MSAPEAALPRPRRRRSRLRSDAPSRLVWIAPALAVVLFVFGYSMVELVRQSAEHKGEWRPRELPADGHGPDLPGGTRAQRRLLLAVPILVLTRSLLSRCSSSRRFAAGAFTGAVFLPFILPIPVVAVIFGQILQLNGS